MNIKHNSIKQALALGMLLSPDAIDLSIALLAS
jgi:hypothetical protein